ncbi:MAG: hypothetical protein FWD13_11295 [Treponema sp.]|nr:hypothetical protein [Treponema sp.]
MLINISRTRQLAVILLTFILVLIPLNSAFGDSFHWAGSGSLFYYAADNSPGADPAPILPSIGFSFSWQFHKFLRLELTEDIYMTDYEYYYNNNLGFFYPRACNPENRSSFVFGFVTGIQLTGAFPLGSNGTTARVYGGPAMDIRVVVLAFGLHPDDLEGSIEKNAILQTEAIRDYFWSDGRWLMPVFGAGMDFPLNEHFLIGFDLRVWFPIYRLWTDKDIPAIDGWRFGAGLRITPRPRSGTSGETL